MRESKEKKAPENVGLLRNRKHMEITFGYHQSQSNVILVSLFLSSHRQLLLFPDERTDETKANVVSLWKFKFRFVQCITSKKNTMYKYTMEMEMNELFCTTFIL